MAARNPRPTGRPRPPIAAEAGEARGVAVGGDTELHPEADAIIGVIRDCLSAIRQKDFRAWAGFWAQAPYVRRIGTQGWDPADLGPWTGLVVHDGWDDIARFMDQMLGDESAIPFPHGTHCENWFLRVRGDTAYITFDQYLLDANGRYAPEVTGVNREMRILEKHSDGWKFNYMSFFHEHPRRVAEPVVLVDEYAAINGMSRTAAERIGNSEALRVRNGRLRARDRDVDKRLSDTIRKAARTTSWESHELVPVLASTPFGSPDCVCWIAPSLDVLGAAVILLDHAPTSRRRLHNAIIVYRLSPAQVRLAERIVDGHDLVSAAEQLGITANTARTHLNRMFEKTSVRSQPALVAALLSVSAPLK